MLRSLTIDGLAIIDHLSIEFTAGLNVITGETGAGKSILIKALNFLMGGKAGVELIRDGWPAASVSGEYLLDPSHPVFNVMKELGLSVANDESQLILRRTLGDKGKSSAWINDVPVRGTTLRTVCTSLVDILGQHENHSLSDPVKNLDVVDAFIADREIVAIVRSGFGEINSLLNQLEELSLGFLEKKRNLDFLEFRLQELSEFKPKSGEYDDLVQRVKEGETQINLMSALGATQLLLDSSFRGEPVSGAFWDASVQLDHVAKLDSHYEELATEAREIAQRAEDLSFRIGRQLGHLETSPELIEELQSRLSTYQALFRKFGVSSADELIKEAENIRIEIDFISNASVRALDIVRSLEVLTSEALENSLRLTDSRKTAALRIEKLVAAEFQDLGMRGSKLQIRVEQVEREVKSPDLLVFGSECDQRWQDLIPHLRKSSNKGSDKIDFYLESNPGEAPKPLHKIASGGELSRIMLALKNSLSSGGSTCVLVFDEVDSGISGRVADMVGAKLREMSVRCQIICISHLPQVAAYHDAHFVVSKNPSGFRTESIVRRLSANESTEEIARLLSADKVTSPSIENARQLRKNARQAVVPADKKL